MDSEIERTDQEATRLTTRDIGRMGGNTTKAKHGRDHYVQMGRKAAQVLKERYGRDHYSRMALSRKQRDDSDQPSEPPSMTASEAGKLGGSAVKERYGRDHFVTAGRRGGATTKERYGSEHYSRIGRIGGMSKASSKGEPSSAQPQE
ncbi:MAG: hypothetical protein ACUVTZ_07720 [Armatimonadota bacterium]